MKLACVVHRYGPQATGGSEAHCRALALRLAATGEHQVDVLTSCATDYITWKNVLPAGESREGGVHGGGVRVMRFPVARQRRLNRFREISEHVFAGRATPGEQDAWFRENGPEMPALLEYLEKHGHEYDRVMFWAFRYYHAWFGVPLVADRAVLVPTAEDDDLIRTATVLGPFFARPRSYLFLTVEERELVAARCEGHLPSSEVIGAGLDPAPAAAPVGPVAAAAQSQRPFLLYLGRVEKNKGCDALIAHYQAYQEAEIAAGREPIALVLAGPVKMAIPEVPRLRVLGFVSDEVRDALMREALAFVMPSPFESLNIAVLEAWNVGTPVLVNGRCRPLLGQTRRANGGLIYERREDFIEALRFLVNNPDAARQFGVQGQQYVEREYRWPVVMSKVEALLAR
jgi:glycosyltransferase involved in cell wall biosynthesis